MQKRKAFILSLALFGLASCSNEPAPAAKTSVYTTESSSATSAASEKETEIAAIYKLYLANGGEMTYEQWLATIKGEPGKDGTALRHGNGAPSPAFGNDGDSYIDLDTWDYYLKTNGAWIKIGCLKGEKGEPGIQGPRGEKGDAGISVISVEKTGSDNLADTYTITYSDGSTSTFVVVNGKKGEQGIQGIPGQDGHTPSITIGENGNWFVDGFDTNVKAQGNTGKSAYDIYCESHSEYVGDEQQWIDDLVNGRLATPNPVYYTVTFDLGYEGKSFTQQVLENKKAKKPEDPTRNGYTFIDWVDENNDHWIFNGFSITEDITLHAVWSDPIEYTVTFVNNNGSVLDVVTGYYGQAITYNGPNPVAANQAPHYIYTFTGWDKDLIITGNMTITATYSTTYSPERIAYYYNYDGETLLAAIPLEEGEAPHYEGDVPLRAPDEANQLQFEFIKWNKVEETESATKFIAEYSTCTSGLVIKGNAVFGYNGTSTNITIPSIWNGQTITEVSTRAFFGCATLTSIFIPSSVTSIGNSAFYGCTSLASIEVDPSNPKYDSRDGCNAIVETSSNAIVLGCPSTVIPQTVTSIGNYAFEGCTSLTSISIPSSVRSIGNNAFYGCASLASVEIPSSVTSIGECAFEGCTSLASISIPSSVTSIGEYAFFGCATLTSIFIPSSVTSIESYAFYGCTSLASIEVDPSNPKYDSRDGCNAIVETSSNAIVLGCTSTVIPYTVTSIGAYAFYGCTSLASIFIPSSVTSIGNLAFAGCTSLASIRRATSVTSIGYGAFEGCTSLTSVEIPSSVRSIGAYAFYGCTSLASISIPSSVTSIGDLAFAGCASLASVEVDPSNPKYDSRDGCNAIVKTSSNAIVLGCSSTVIPSSVTSIGNSAFYGCTSLTSISIPSSVTSIGNHAFYGCTSLASVEIPSSVTSIGEYAFFGCATLASIFIPSSVTSIGEYAFRECGSLTIFCQVSSKPNSWNWGWNYDSRPVHWGAAQ